MFDSKCSPQYWHTVALSRLILLHFSQIFIKKTPINFVLLLKITTFYETTLTLAVATIEGSEIYVNVIVASPSKYVTNIPDTN